MLQDKLQIALALVLRRNPREPVYSTLRRSSTDLNSEDGLLKDELDNRNQASEDGSTYDVEGSRGSHRPYLLIWMNLLLFVVSITSFAFTVFEKNSSPKHMERNHYLKMTSEKSPILDQIDIPLSTWRLNATFIEMDPISIYRQRPSPEVDRAWERVETQTPIPISREDILAQGKDPDDSVRWPEEFGFGPDAFIGRIDVFHQIHCLNVLRKHLHFNYDYYYAGERMNKYHELHTGHCLHILLQNIMCTGNVDVYPHFWADAQENAVPDFNINHKCRDFEAILDWHDKHAVPLDEFGALRIPGDMKPRIMVHAFKEAFEWYDEDHPDDGNLGTAVG